MLVSLFLICWDSMSAPEDLESPCSLALSSCFLVPVTQVPGQWWGKPVSFLEWMDTAPQKGNWSQGHWPSRNYSEMSTSGRPTEMEQDSMRQEKVLSDGLFRVHFGGHRKTLDWDISLNSRVRFKWMKSIKMILSGVFVLSMWQASVKKTIFPSIGQESRGVSRKTCWWVLSIMSHNTILRKIVTIIFLER